MVGDSTNDKLRLLSALNDVDSGDEDEIFNEQSHKKQGNGSIKARLTNNSDDPRMSLADENGTEDPMDKTHSKDEFAKYHRRAHANFYRLMLLMFNFVLNVSGFT